MNTIFFVKTVKVVAGIVLAHFGVPALPWLAL